MGYMLYHELFETFTGAVSKEEKIKVLQKFALSRGGSRLPEFLNAAFNPAVKFDITKIPKYTPSPLPAGLNDTYLHQELAKMYMFIEGHPRRTAKLPLKKEQTILTQILSYLHAGEASLFCALLEKTLSLHVPGLTAQLAKEAFPDLPFEPGATRTTAETAAAPKAKKSKKTA